MRNAAGQRREGRRERACIKNRKLKITGHGVGGRKEGRARQRR